MACLAHASDFPKSLKQAASGLSVPHNSQATPGPMLAAAGLSSQLGPSWIPLSPASVSGICRSHCSSCWVAPDRTWAAADLGLHLPWEAPKPVQPVDSFRPHQSITTQPPPQATQSRGRLRGHQSPAEVSPAMWVDPCTADPQWWLQPVLAADQSEDKSFPLTCQQQSRLNDNRQVYTAHTVGTP